MSELLDALAESVDGTVRELHFEGEDLSDLDLGSVEFEDCTFSNCSFCEARFERPSFERCDLTACDLSNARASSAFLRGCRLLECRAVGIDLHQSILTRSRAKSSPKTAGTRGSCCASSACR